MPTPDGKVIIEVESNAKRAADDFNKFEKTIRDSEKALKVLEAQGKSETQAFKDLSASIQKSKEQLKGINNETVQSKNAFSGLQGQMMNLKGAIVGVALAFVGMKLLELSGSVLKIAGDFEQLNVAFSVLAGQQAGQQLVKDLTDLANVTPMTTQGLAENAKLLLSFGEATSNIIPDLKMLGDISGGNQQKMDSLTLAFAQSGAAGRLMGQDLLQMVNAGFQPLEYISKKTGESMFQLRKRMEAGTLAFSEVRQAMVDAISEGGRFYGLMNEQSQTLQGKLSTLSDKWALVGKAIGDKFLPMAKDAVNAMISLADSTMETIKWLESEQSTLDHLKNSWDKYWASKRKADAQITFDFTPWKKQQEEMQKIAKKTTATSIPQVGFKDSSAEGATKKTKVSKSTEFDLYTKQIGILQDKLKMLSIKGQENTKTFRDLRAELEQKTIKVNEANKAIEVQTNAYDKLQYKLKDVEEQLKITASAKVVDVSKFNILKQQATELKLKLDEVNKSTEIKTGSYDILSQKINDLKNQLQDLAASGQGGTSVFDDLKNQYVEATNEMKNINTQIANASGLDWANVSNSIKSSLASALTTPLQEGESAFQRLGNVAMNIISMIGQQLVEKLVIDKLIGAFTGSSIGTTIGGFFGGLFGSANGNVFNNGNPVKAYATGGIVSSPTLFPMANGGTGLMGEAGAEAIMPLKRGSNGKLGVQTTGTQSNVKININNYAGVQTEQIMRSPNEIDINIKKVNSALMSERTNTAFSMAANRQQPRGIQAS